MRQREPSLGEFVRIWLRRPGDRRPRRLVLALPPAGLVEPVAADVAAALADLGLTATVALHVVAGQPPTGGPDWRMEPHRPAVVVGPADVLVSRALNRGLDTHRELWPIEFALLTNGAHWVVTDPEHCPQSTLTLRRLVDVADRWPTAQPLRLTVRAGRTDVLPRQRDDIVAAAREEHLPGTRTVLALPTLAAARHASVARGDLPVTLLHPYFRPADRLRALARVCDADTGPDRIVVATAQAAVGIEAATRLAVPPTTAPRPLSLVDADDLTGWFDTEPDGSTVDEYVLDDAGEAQLAWAHWTPVDGSGRPPAQVRAPDARARCRAPLAEVRALAARAPVWRFDPAAEDWTLVDDAAPPRPGELLLAAADAGGYDPDTGIDPAVTAPVPDCPTIDGPREPVPGRGWLSLTQHSTDVRDQARALLAATGPALPPAAGPAVVTAGYVHDAGKWHPVWQDALCALAAADERDRVAAGRPWAKSGIEGALEFADGVRFRHELASLTLLDGPLRGLLADADDPDLVRYLVLAHHGKLRRRVDPEQYGLKPGRVTATPPMLGQPAGVLTEDPTPFVDGSWTATVDALLARYGPFRLAYLEMLVRMADWRASAGLASP
jgi:CRISPR-associated endonuclease/helicase Cas3